MKKYLIILVSAIFVGAFTFWVFEPSEVQSQTATTTVSVSLTVTSEINISCSTSSVALSPSIPGQTGGSATGSFSCTAETNDTSGYTMSIKEDHKLQTDASGNPNTYFADYSPATTTPDYLWVAPSSGNEIFGFNITAGTDTVQKYKDDGTSCNTGTNVTADRCWNGFATSTDETVASRNNPTPAGGVATSFGLKAEAAGSNNLQEGSYSNTLTVTAVTNP